MAETSFLTTYGCIGAGAFNGTYTWKNNGSVVNGPNNGGGDTISFGTLPAPLTGSGWHIQFSYQAAGNSIVINQIDITNLGILDITPTPPTLNLGDTLTVTVAISYSGN